MTIEDVDVIDKASQLDMDISSVKHFMLSDGSEVIGEVFDGADISKSFLIVNPLRVIRDIQVTEFGSETQNYYTEWNPCSDGPFTKIEAGFVLSKANPNEPALTAYIKSIHNTYFPWAAVEKVLKTLEEIKPQEESPSEPITNVIQFVPYLLAKQALKQL